MLIAKSHDMKQRVTRYLRVCIEKKTSFKSRRLYCTKYRKQVNIRGMMAYYHISIFQAINAKMPMTSIYSIQSGANNFYYFSTILEEFNKKNIGTSYWPNLLFEFTI
ncbi:hypothetical protein HHI36_014570 [Cryptolaemus montrouzieri]|uniref:Uncharacterized protein n=1 Tax=Cryptolaemus montrouzieri TaxID=559131 RepID=A0ABD2N495_9CUCU